MSTMYQNPLTAEMRQALVGLRGGWLWFVLLGIALIVLGCVALGSPWIASLAVAVVFGALLLVGGAFEIVGAVWSRGWSGFLLHLLSGVMSIVVGALFLTAPADAVFALTLLLACLLMVGGIFRSLAVLIYRFPGWGWPLLSGIVDVILGVLIWLGWPESSLWVIGLFVGISLVFRGCNWIGMGLVLSTLPKA